MTGVTKVCGFPLQAESEISIVGIMAELSRAGLIDTSVSRVDSPTLEAILTSHDITSDTASAEARDLYLSAPGNIDRNLVMGSQQSSYKEADLDRRHGCIRSAEHAFSKDGGLLGPSNRR